MWFAALAASHDTCF